MLILQTVFFSISTNVVEGHISYQKHDEYRNTKKEFFAITNELISVILQYFDNTFKQRRIQTKEAYSFIHAILF